MSVLNVYGSGALGVVCVECVWLWCFGGLSVLNVYGSGALGDSPCLC